MDLSELSIFFKNTEQAEITDRYLLQINQSFTALQSQLEQQNQKIESLEAKIIGQYQTIIDILQPKVKIEKQIDEHKSDLKPNITINTSQTVGEKEGVWIDQSTGLMWSRINIGQNWRNGSCHGNAINTSWDDAKKLCQQFDLAGFKDWRLPTKDELKKLARMNKNGELKNILYDISSGNDVWHYYWSSTAHDFEYNLFYLVVFYNLTITSDRKDSKNYIRPVRNIGLG